MKKKKYIITLSNEYINALYEQQVYEEHKLTKQQIIQEAVNDIKEFLYGDLDTLVNFRFNAQKAFSIETFSGATLKDLRKKGKRIRFV